MAECLKKLEFQPKTNPDYGLRISRYKDEIAGEEEFYEQLTLELQSSEDDLKVDLIERDVTSEKKFSFMVSETSFIEAFIDKDGELQCNGPIDHFDLLRQKK